MDEKMNKNGKGDGARKAVKDARVEKIIHPNSRKALQLRRSRLRTDRLQGTRSARITTRIFPLLDRFTWFQLALDPEEGPRSLWQVRELIEAYLDRHTEEIGRLRAEQRPRRPIPKRLDQLFLVQGAERAEYEGPGFELPDLTNENNLEAFRRWDGTRESLDLIRTTRVRRQ